MRFNIAAAAFLSAVSAFSEPVLTEAGREIPLVQDVDVLVIGGTTAAVAAARQAAAAGAKVFLAAPRPYLGEDMAGKLRLRLEEEDDSSCEIFRRIFTPENNLGGSLPFTYTADQTAQKAHPDPNFKKLNDGRFDDNTRDSVQYSGDVTITVDLGAVIESQEVTAVIYKRDVKDGFGTASIALSGSVDGTNWSAPDTVWESSPAEFYEGAKMSWPITKPYRYFRLKCVKDEHYPRQLIGEIMVHPKNAQSGRALADRTTPLRVKKTLDRVLLDNSIPFFTGTLVCGILTDERGLPAGAVMANRNGRQAIKAKVIIDATERGQPTRMAGASSAPFPAGNYVFRRTVISGESPHAEHVKVSEQLGIYPVRVQGNRETGKIDARMFLCDIELPMKDGSARSFAEVEQKVRDLTFTPTQTEAADTVSFLPPDHFYGKTRSAEKWSGAERFDINAMRPKDAEWIFVLSALADAPREIAEILSRPGNLMRIGERVGKAAAELAKTRPNVQKVTLSGKPTENTAVKVGEHTKPLPQYLVNTSGTVSAAPRDLPVLAECDVLVAGAGTGGGPAGIAAARFGAKTIVCEYLYQMGGVQTDGLIGSYYWGNRVGFTSEIDDGVKATGAVLSQCKSEWYRKENRKSGAETWYGTLANGVIVENGRLTGVVVLTPDGQRGVIRCKVAIDCTGNAELPALAGEETEFITDAELAVQGVGMTPRNMGASYTNTDIGFCDDTDSADLFFFALRSRLSMGNNIWDQAQVVNSRERRRMVGAFYMSPLDVVNERTYPDVVVQTFSNFDSHGETVHEQFFIEDPGHHGMKVNLPYRCFLPKKLDGLLVTGLGISAHRDAMPILRMQPDVQNQGYAAGVAAAMSVKDGVAVRNVDIRKLQRHLVEKKILPEEVMKWKDSYPLPDQKFKDAVASLPDKYQGLQVLLVDSARSIPLLRKAFRDAENNSDAKFVYAHVLALLGDREGESLLIDKVKSDSWDKGWNYRGMGQYNRSVSWLDSYIICLGRCKSDKALPAIIEKAAQLSPQHEYSHFRAIGLALEAIGKPDGAQVLGELLKNPEIGGHAIAMGKDIPVFKDYSNKNGDWERTLCLRELALARALYRIGDYEGIGKRIMTAYARDPRGAYATHAKLVLGEK